MTETETLASSFCRLVAENSKLNSAHARFGMWLIGVAEKLGGWPVEVSYSEVRAGFTRDGIEIEGTGSRIETTKAAAEALEALGVLQVEEGKYAGFGYHATKYTIKEI
jgi:hypothetical protein